MRRAPAQVNLSVQTNQVERWINQRTWGRLRDLSVERTGNAVVIHGRAGSYYHKQLALAAALESVDPEILVFDIDVIPSHGQIH